jgi:hypothetical protein
MSPRATSTRRTDAINRSGRASERRSVTKLTKAVALFPLVAVCLLSCSSRGQRTITGVNDAPFSLRIVIEHFAGPPLSAEEDDIYLVRKDGKRELVFSGYGASSVDFLGLPDRTLLILYCGGSIIKTKTSVLETNEPDSERMLRVQPVLTEGLSVNGAPLCQSRSPELR